MIGIFDSGMGGENTLTEVRRISPRVDITLLKDVKNAPYGTKDERELIRIAEGNIDRLISLGARCVLIGCCTASTVYDKLGMWHRAKSIPIIGASATEAMRASSGGKIALLATKRTVDSRAFESYLGKDRVIGIEAQRLVSFIESGECDGHLSGECREYIEELLAPLCNRGADTLILGCTHFPSLMNTIAESAKKYGIKNTVSSPAAGASALFETLGDCTQGDGITVRIE